MEASEGCDWNKAGSVLSLADQLLGAWEPFLNKARVLLDALFVVIEKAALFRVDGPDARGSVVVDSLGGFDGVCGGVQRLQAAKAEYFLRELMSLDEEIKRKMVAKSERCSEHAEACLNRLRGGIYNPPVTVPDPEMLGNALREASTLLRRCCEVSEVRLKNIMDGKVPYHSWIIGDLQQLRASIFPEVRISDENYDTIRSILGTADS